MAARRAWPHALPPELRERLPRECERLALAEQQLVALEKARQASLAAPPRASEVMP
ncbi:hypothetical protein GCM10027081_27000 [Cupriavidus yeoncheonensis]|uniref:hypothetical protein n=1 Tax=Cupriavidus yeoncheonensis TaxID=1462994 RepID=UPI001E570266|nr:hypothetical protein [Cupriavidus yeoncheonensis]